MVWVFWCLFFGMLCCLCFWIITRTELRAESCCLGLEAGDGGGRDWGLDLDFMDSVFLLGEGSHG